MFVTINYKAVLQTWQWKHVAKTQYKVDKIIWHQFDELRTPLFVKHLYLLNAIVSVQQIFN